MTRLSRSIVNAIQLGVNLLGLYGASFSDAPDDEQGILELRVLLDDIGLSNLPIPSDREARSRFVSEVPMRLTVVGKQKLADAVRLGSALAVYDETLQSKIGTLLDNLITLANKVGVAKSSILDLVQERTSIHQPDQAEVLFRHIRSWMESLPDSADEEVSNMVVVLFLAADPTNASRLRLGEEFREIDEQLTLSKLREGFSLALPQLSLRSKDIARALLNTQPQIVHFSGHGTPQGALCFENEIGERHDVQPDALAALFEQFADQVNCVVLNACYSDVQAKAIAEHINYVIGMNKAIGDKAAIAFALGFYGALGAGRTIEDAYKLGCVQMILEGIPEHLTPVLIKKGHA